MSKRIAIVLAGPAANLLLAIAVYWVLNVIGVMEPQAILGQPAAATAAADAGIAAGDRVVEVEGEPVRSWNELRWILLQRAVGGRPISLAVGADGRLAAGAHAGPASIASGELDGDVIGRLGVVPYSGPPRVGRVTEGGAAARAGLQAGDRIVAAERPSARFGARADRTRARLRRTSARIDESNATGAPFG